MKIFLFDIEKRILRLEVTNLCALLCAKTILLPPVLRIFVAHFYLLSSGFWFICMDIVPHATKKK